MSTPPPMPPPMERQFTYDTKYKKDTEGEAFLRLITGGYYDNFLDNISKEQEDAINVYQNVNQCDIMHKALDLGQLELYNKVAKDLNQSTYVGKDKEEQDAIDFIRSKTTVPDYVETVNDLDELFDSLPPTPVTLTTYRCYANYIDLERLKELFQDTPSSNKRYVSTSLSRSLVEQWCAKGNTRLRICILIPKGSMGVLPLLLFKKENFKQNEITLPRTCALKYSGFNHDLYGYPIFVYVKDKSESIDDYIPMIEEGNYNLVKPLYPARKFIRRLTKGVELNERPVPFLRPTPRGKSGFFTAKSAAPKRETGRYEMGGKRKTRRIR